MEGGTTFTFVTGGIESALEQARAVAGDKDVLIAGGAEAAQQYLKAGLLDEIQLHVAPLLLGGGTRLFDDLGPDDAKLELAEVDRVPVGHPHQVPRPALAARRREVLVVRSPCPTAAPLPADR